MNKSKKPFIKSQSKVENQYFIGKYLRNLTSTKKKIRKIWSKVLLIFTIVFSHTMYFFKDRLYDIRDWYRQVLKYISYCIEFLKKIFKSTRYFIIHFIMLLFASYILINWLEQFIFIRSFFIESFISLSTIKFIIIFLIIVGFFWWFITPEKHTRTDFLLRVKEFFLRLLFAVIVVSGFYFGISYPPLWFTNLNITYDESASFFSNQTWFFIPKRISSLHEPLNIRNILIGILGLVSLIFLWWRNTIADDNLKLEKKRRLDERFHEATQTLSRNLNSKTYPSHIGGISTLTQLALDSKEQTQRCLDVICSCNEWMKPLADEFKYDRTQKCYSERELYRDINFTAKKSKNIKDLRDNLNKKIKWESSVFVQEEKRSQKALNAVALILQTIANYDLQIDNNFIKLSELNFRGMMLCGINLRGLKLVGINLIEANLNGADLQDANLNNAKLQDVKLNWANLPRIKLKEADLTRAKLRKSILCGANLLKANIRDAELHGADLSNSNLLGSTLYKKSSHFDDIQNASLYGANLENAQLQCANLCNAQLQGANLQNTHLQFADLHGAELQGANLENAQLQGDDLHGAQLQGAYLLATQLEGANMQYSNLQATFLCRTQLLGANLSHSDIACSIIWKTNFYGVDLNEVLINYCRLTNVKNKLFEGITNGYIGPLIFGDISEHKYTRGLDSIKRIKEKWPKEIMKDTSSLEREKEFKMRIKKGMELMKKRHDFPELDKLKGYSFIKEKGKKVFVMQHNKSVIRLKKQWIELANLDEAVAVRLISYQEIRLFDKRRNEIEIMDKLISKLNKGVYKKLKKTPRLKKLIKEIHIGVRFSGFY